MVLFRDRLATLLGLVLILLSPAVTLGEDPVDGIVEELVQLSDVVQQAHVQPPVRQQMMLAAMRAVADAVDEPLTETQTKRFSHVSANQLRPLVKELLEHFQPAAEEKDVTLKAMAIPGLLHSVPGTVRLVTADQLEVQRGSDRFLSNTYVGVGIALEYNEERKMPRVTEVFESGPGYTAGVETGDWIQLVDGRNTMGLTLQEIIKLLRGPEDSSLEVVVRKPESEDTRQLHIVRRIVPRQLIGDYRVVDDRIAYLRVEQIAASTVQELRRFEHQAHQDDCQALVLDMRGCGQSELHYAVTLGDALSDGEPLGRLRTRAGVTVYTAQPESLFPGWPFVVLLDRESSDHAAWLAASLRANRRAHVLGFDFIREYFDYAPVSMPDSDLAIIMATGRLLAPPTATGKPESVTVPIPVTARESLDQLMQRATKLINNSV